MDKKGEKNRIRTYTTLKIMSVMGIIGQQAEMYANCRKLVSLARSGALLTSLEKRKQVIGRKEDFRNIFTKKKKVCSMAPE